MTGAFSTQTSEPIPSFIILEVNIIYYNHIFEKNKQTNEFGHYAGDKENPTCLANEKVC